MEQRSRLDLQDALAALRPIADHVSIRGDRAAEFVLAERGERGVELYGDSNCVAIDCALDEKLLGEQEFDSLESALLTAKEWLLGEGRR